MNTVHYDIEWLKGRYESGGDIRFFFFWGHRQKTIGRVGKECFSQWYIRSFVVDDIEYKTAEHWMMAGKALLFEDLDSFNQIINCDSPQKAKALGRNVKDYEDQLWDEHKFRIVREGNIHKFNQHPDLLECLLQTGDQVIVEASPMDLIWGIGLTQDSADATNIYSWRGQNLLGFALMEARDFLKSFGTLKPVIFE